MTTRREEQRAARRRIFYAALLSLLVHLTAVVLMAWFYTTKPPSAPAPVEDIEITFVPQPAPAPKTQFVDSRAPDAPAPERAAFESDRNTAAASPEKAQGTQPVPTQDGREQGALEMENTQLALAKPAEVPPSPEHVAAPPTPPQKPKTAPTASATPAALKPDEIGLSAKAEPLREPPREVPHPPPAPPPSRPSYRRQARATRLRGSIDNSGRASVASLATPLGRYRKAVSDAVGSSWYYHINSRLDMFSYGTVVVLFAIDKNGRAHHPRVLSNTSNESFEIVTVESILAAEIPPIPPDVLPALEGERIEIDFSFSIITN